MRLVCGECISRCQLSGVDARLMLPAIKSLTVPLCHLVAKDRRCHPSIERLSLATYRYAHRLMRRVTKFRTDAEAFVADNEGPGHWEANCGNITPADFGC